MAVQSDTMESEENYDDNRGKKLAVELAGIGQQGDAVSQFIGNVATPVLVYHSHC